MQEDRNEFPHFLGKQIDFILPSRFPTEKAHGIVTVEMARAASELGYQVQIIAPNLSSESVKNPEDLRISLLNSSAIKKVVALRDSSQGKPSQFYLKLQVFVFFISLLTN